MNLFGAVSADDIRTAQIVTGVTMALFIGTGIVPGLRPYAGRIRMVLLALYLLAFAMFMIHLLVV